jgi:predicted nucleic acid-binding protein
MEGGHRLGSKQDLILIDTNVFVIDLRYKRDPGYEINRKFLHYIHEKGNGFTTVINLLEICGILSFNLKETQLFELWSYFEERYGVIVLPVPTLETNFPILKLREVFDFIKERASLGDALILSVAGKHLPFVNTMVSWDASHFENVFPGVVLNPAKFLKEARVDFSKPASP